MAYKLGGEKVQPISYNELYAVKYILLILSALENGDSYLEDRMRGAGPRVLNMYRSGRGMIQRAFDAIVETIPDKKRKSVNEDIQHSDVIIQRVLGTPSEKTRTLTVGVQKTDFEWLMNKIIADNCWFCTKKGHDANLCPIRQHMGDSVLYDFTPCKKGQYCMYAEGVITVGDEEQEMIQ